MICWYCCGGNIGRLCPVCKRVQETLNPAGAPRVVETRDGVRYCREEVLRDLAGGEPAE